MAFRFVHAADLHLDSPFTGIRETAPQVADVLRRATFEAYDRLIQLCIDRRAGALLVAGDIFDSADRSLTAQIRFVRGLEHHHGRKGGPSTITTADRALAPEAARPALLGHATASTSTSVFEFDLHGLSWITTLRAPTIRKLVHAGTVALSWFDERDLAEVTSEEFPGERLIVCRNPLLAAERQRTRQELLAATEKDLAPIAAATRRTHQPLRGASAIGIRVGTVINRRKMAKHVVTKITDESFTFRRNEEKIAAEEQLDGLYNVRSNVEPEQFDAVQTVRAYTDLSTVEWAFRCFKSVNLTVRPLHHRRADRVRAHILLCMLAYYVEWHMRRALAPLLFDDHDLAAAAQDRTSVVARARRSPVALATAGRTRTDDDLPVHSFRMLLTDLGTLTANPMQVADEGGTFTLQTQPTPVQQRCFKLLGVRRACSRYRHHVKRRNCQESNDFCAILSEASL